jgi:hypothetical protein
MTTQQLERLERLRYYRTLYEVAITSPDGTRYLVGYASQGRAKREACIARASQRIATLTGIPSNRLCLHYGGAWSKAAHTAWTISDGEDGAPTAWSVNYTGRTEREAIQAGELPR